jgi:3-oxoacyl-[acyl-carrier-protein] synthase-3
VSELLLAPAPGVARDRGTRIGASVVSAGSCFPEQVVPTDAIAGPMGIEADWLVRRTGVAFRHKAASGERLTDVAASAARRALSRADVAPSDVDLIIVATMTPDDLTPHTAAIVAADIGARGAGAIDLNAACTGFVSGIALACGQIESGRAANVLLVGAETMSRITDPDDRGTAAVFADGAGAVLMRGAEEGRIGPIVLGSDGANADLVLATRAEGITRMQGHDTFRHAVERMAEASGEAAAAAGLTLAEIDLFVYHQANARILRSVGERLDLPVERVVDSIVHFGNTSAASIPLALEDARLAGDLEPGANVLIAAFGAGLTWGATVIEWGSGCDE